MTRRKYTPEEQERINEAHADWTEQCKNFMYGMPFRDESMKDCLKRHGVE